MPDDPADATPFVPETRSLAALREAAQGCRGCHLYERATQAVFGEGPGTARMMLVGEMPGDREDLAGHVFVGPAGRELDRALDQVGIDRSQAYVTNVVKHSSSRSAASAGSTRRPQRWEVGACDPWLRAELEAVRPEVIVILGATAGKALLGSSFRLAGARGRAIDSALAPVVTATIHPAAILRARDDEARQAQRAAFVEDLAFAARSLAA